MQSTWLNWPNLSVSLSLNCLWYAFPFQETRQCISNVNTLDSDYNDKYKFWIRLQRGGVTFIQPRNMIKPKEAFVSTTIIHFHLTDLWCTTKHRRNCSGFVSDFNSKIQGSEGFRRPEKKYTKRKTDRVIQLRTLSKHILPICCSVMQSVCLFQMSKYKKQPKLMYEYQLIWS